MSGLITWGTPLAGSGREMATINIDIYPRIYYHLFKSGCAAKRERWVLTRGDLPVSKVALVPFIDISRTARPAFNRKAGGCEVRVGSYAFGKKHEHSQS